MILAAPVHLKIGGAVCGGVAHSAAESRACDLLDVALPHQSPPMPLQLRFLAH